MRAQDWASNRPTTCGTRPKPAHVRWHSGLSHGQASTQPGRRAVATHAAAGWRDRRHPTGRWGAGKLAETAHARRGGGDGHGGTDGDAPRRWRDDGVAGSTWDGGVSVEGLLWRSPVAWRGVCPAARNGGERGLSMAWLERKRSRGAGKVGGDGGSTLFKGRDEETADGGWSGRRGHHVALGGRGAWPQPTGGTVWTGACHPLTCGPRLAVGGRGEVRGAWAGPGEKGEVGQAQMNRKVFDLIKEISN
jgi:hypothetical protein